MTTSAPLGGTIEFLNLADGTFFERRWELRLPRITNYMQVNPGFDGPNVARQKWFSSLQVSGGEVLEMRRGSDILYSSTPVVLTSDGGDRNREMNAADSLTISTICGQAAAAEVASGAIMGTLRLRGDTRASGANVVAEWQDTFRASSTGEGRWSNQSRSTISIDDGTFVLCGVPRGRTITVVSSSGDRRSQSLLVQIPDGSSRSRLARVELRLDQFDGAKSMASRAAVAAGSRALGADGEARKMLEFDLHK